MSRKQCPLAVVPIRKEPSDRSEMTSQALFGETMEQLDANEKWAMVRMEHDGYEGWIDRKQIIDADSSHLVNEMIHPLFLRAIDSLQSCHYLPAGSIIHPLKNGSFESGGTIYNVSEQFSQSSELVSASKMFMGTPYLWGGRTFMGIDCSGFTQIVHRLIGYSLPRDAYQQAEIGDPVSFVEESTTGDLAFFDNAEGRITHVGIILKEGDKHQIIHASGCVRMDALDHQGIFNATTGKYSHNLRIIKRLKK